MTNSIESVFVVEMDINHASVGQLPFGCQNLQPRGGRQLFAYVDFWKINTRNEVVAADATRLVFLTRISIAG